jgi:hypothetical protein
MNLNDYLKLNSNAIVELVNKKYVPIEDEMTEEPTFEELAGLLMGMVIGLDESTGEVGKRDELHNVLAMTMIYSLWCGGVSQMKTDKGAYMRGTVEGIKKSITDAFEIGQKYLKDQP